MFGLSFGEIVLIGIVAMVVVGPRNMIPLMRSAGQAIGRLRRMANDLRAESGIDEILNAEGIRTEIDNFKRLASGAISPDELSANVVPDREREYPRVGPDSYGAFSEDIIPYLPATLPEPAAAAPTAATVPATATVPTTVAAPPPLPSRPPPPPPRPGIPPPPPRSGAPLPPPRSGAPLPPPRPLTPPPPPPHAAPPAPPAPLPSGEVAPLPGAAPATASPPTNGARLKN